MTQLWLVRHGQTDWNLEGRYQGQSDIPLNATGLAQAEAFAARLEVGFFGALYSSDLQRALQTARPISHKTGLPVRTDPRLREIFQGEWQGRTLVEIREAYRGNAQAARGVVDPAAARAPGGESVLEVSQRLGRAATDIALAHPSGGPVLLVSHGLALATLICLAEGLPLAEVYSHIPENTEAAIINWPPG